LEASRHAVHMWCGSSEYARVRGGGGVCGSCMWRNVGICWMLLFGTTFEIQGDASRAPVWKEGEGELHVQTSGDKVIGCERRLYTYLLLEPTPLLLSLRQAAPSHHFNATSSRDEPGNLSLQSATKGGREYSKRDSNLSARVGLHATRRSFFSRRSKGAQKKKIRI